MAEDSAQERTEEATPRRRQQARERGQVAQSRELNTMLMLMFAGGAAWMLGPHIMERLLGIIKDTLSLDRESIYNVNAMPALFGDAVLDALLVLTPFLIVMVIASIAGPIAVGGLNFSPQALAFKTEKLDPVKGLQRVFAWRGLMELLKALVKFVVIGLVAMLFLYSQADAYLGLSAEPVGQAMVHAGRLLVMGFLVIGAATILIAAVDVPFQIWDHQRQLKMTHQEVKDDTKDTEGNPEVRGRARRMQREIAQRRMMAEVPKADVVVTNPQHYSVALRYDANKMKAPVVVAKGADLIAMQIRSIAREHDVALLQAPPLARALYHTTELEQEIPSGLYLAVAKVLAYVFQVKRKPGRDRDGTLRLDDLPIPDDMQFDS
jgi:flagellar biosynthetic protein FlhB